MSIAERLAQARLYLVIDAEAAERVVPAALDGGVDLVQLREKSASDDEILEIGRRLRDLCHEHGALFIVNDRSDLALACDADGVHVGQDDMPLDEARALMGHQRIVGSSTHSPEQVDAALRSGADYFAVGPVYATPTKPGRPAVGLELVRYAATHSTAKPWFAIGGIDESNVGDVARAGATRIVVVRAIRNADDPRAAAAALRLEESHVH